MPYLAKVIAPKLQLKTAALVVVATAAAALKERKCEKTGIYCAIFMYGYELKKGKEVGGRQRRRVVYRWINQNVITLDQTLALANLAKLAFN